MDLAVLRAQGMFAAFVATLFQRAGVISAEEFGRTLGIFAVAASPEDPKEGDILALWAAMVLDGATALGTDDPQEEESHASDL